MNKTRRGHGNKRSLVATIARERIEILFDLARKKTREKDTRLARRYVELAKKISSRTKVPIPRMEKRFHCKKCLLPLIPGLNAKVRLSPETSTIKMTCLTCGRISRYPYLREKKTSRKNGEPLYDSAARGQRVSSGTSPETG